MAFLFTLKCFFCYESNSESVLQLTSLAVWKLKYTVSRSVSAVVCVYVCNATVHLVLSFSRVLGPNRLVMSELLSHCYVNSAVSDVLGAGQTLLLTHGLTWVCKK